MGYYLLQALVAVGIVIGVLVVIGLFYKVGEYLEPNESDPPEKFIIGLLASTLVVLGLVLVIGGVFGLWHLAGKILQFFIQPEVGP